MSTPGGYSRISDDGIIHGERRNGAAACCACSICCCLGLCCLIGFGLLIAGGIIVWAVIAHLSSDRFGFEHYTAEMYYDYGGGHGIYALETVFDERIYSSQLLYNGDVVSNTFTDDFKDYTISCGPVGDHDNCYRLTDNSVGGFHLTYWYSLEEENTDCPDVPDPVVSGHKKRKLDKCNHYYINLVLIKQHVWTEVDNDYPVRIHSQVFDEQGDLTTNVTIDYPYFDSDKPTNKSCLDEPKGVTIWDFRDQESDDLPQFVYSLFGRSAARLLKTKMTANNLVRMSSTSDNSAMTDFVRKAELNKLLREWMHLPMSMSSVAGVGVGATPVSVKRRDQDINAPAIPDSFDARDEFSYCSPVISSISDQGQCGSCWAMASAAAFSDRACIVNKSTDNFSPQYMVDCYMSELGCNGGFVGTVYTEMKKYGIVSEDCVPFKEKDAACPTKCSDGTTITDNMKLRPSSFFSPWGKTDEDRVEAIQREIMTNGPVATSFFVFSGFKKISSKTTYSRKSSEKLLGGHMVRIIGWGADGDDDYWLVANSWGKSWGDDGLFRIRRGNNECNIENTVVACLFN